MRIATCIVMGLRAPRWVLALIALTGSGAEAQTVTYNGSLSYSRGSYVFAEPTSSFWLSNGLSVRAGQVSLSANLPVIVQNSGIVSFVAGQPLPTGGQHAGAVGRREGGEPIGMRRGPGGGMTPGMGMTPAMSGISAQPVDGGSQTVQGDSTTVVFRDAYEVQVGDPFLSGSLELYSGLGSLRSVQLDVSAKAPLRSVESGVGTGAWDVGAGASVVVGSGTTLLLGNMSYWSYGDLEDLELLSGLLYGVTVSRSLSGGEVALSATLSGASAIVETMDAPLSGGVGVLFLPRIGRAVSAGVSFGLSEASPDIALYLGWSVRLGG